MKDYISVYYNNKKCILLKSLPEIHHYAYTLFKNGNIVRSCQRKVSQHSEQDIPYKGKCFEWLAFLIRNLKALHARPLCCVTSTWLDLLQST